MEARESLIKELVSDALIGVPSRLLFTGNLALPGDTGAWRRRAERRGAGEGENVAILARRSTDKVFVGIRQGGVCRRLPHSNAIQLVLCSFIHRDSRSNSCSKWAL